MKTRENALDLLKREDASIFKRVFSKMRLYAFHTFPKKNQKNFFIPKKKCVFFHLKKKKKFKKNAFYCILISLFIFRLKQNVAKNMSFNIKFITKLFYDSDD